MKLLHSLRQSKKSFWVEADTCEVKRGIYCTAHVSVLYTVYLTFWMHIISMHLKFVHKYTSGPSDTVTKLDLTFNLVYSMSDMLLSSCWRKTFGPNGSKTKLIFAKDTDLLPCCLQISLDKLCIYQFGAYKWQLHWILMTGPTDLTCIFHAVSKQPWHLALYSTIADVVGCLCTWLRSNHGYSRW